jgi:tetratricopeptide (TPR) repeat protein
MSDPGSPPSVVQGRIDPKRPIQSHLARALLPLVRGRRTGALQVAVSVPRPARTQIVIVEGKIVFAEAEADASRLLQRLAAQGALGAPQAIRLERELLENRGWSGMVRASELAVTHAEVPPHVAHMAISEVVRERVSSALRVLEGEWAYRDDPRAASVPRYPVAFERTVIEALAHTDVAPAFEQALERYARHYPRLEGDSKENTTLFGMTPARFRTLRLLDGTHALSEILAQSPMGTTEAAALVAALTIFERIWWNATPSPRAPTGAVPAQRPQAPARPLTMERPPTAIEELRALEHAPRGPTPPPASHRAPSQIRMPTPSTGDGRPLSSPGHVPTPALVQELLRRHPSGRPPATQAATAQPAGAPPSHPETLTPQGHFDRGKTHLAAGRLHPAALELGRAFELEPDNVTYKLHARFARYLAATSADERAALAKEVGAMAAQRARDVETDAFAFHVIGRIAFDQGDDDRARKAFRAAERNDPKDVETQRYQRLLVARQKK